MAKHSTVPKRDWSGLSNWSQGAVEIFLFCFVFLAFFSFWWPHNCFWNHSRYFKITLWFLKLSFISWKQQLGFYNSFPDCATGTRPRLSLRTLSPRSTVHIFPLSNSTFMSDNIWDINECNTEVHYAFYINYVIYNIDV